MRVNKQSIIIISLLAMYSFCGAQEVLSLDTCRARALRANLGLKQAEAKREQMKALEKAALMQMLPKVSANGGYVWMEKSVNLLSEEQKEELNHIGNRVQGDISDALHAELGNLPIGGDILADRLDAVFANSQFVSSLNELGSELVTDMTTDTRNTSFGLVTLTQPVYMGGKLLAMHRTAALMDRLAGVELSEKEGATLVSVDEAYWQVVSVKHKTRLAEQYAALLDTLQHNVELLVEAQMATQGDLAKVRVKRNEAQMSLTKARNGLVLSKMLLAERCGMPLESEFEVENGERSGEWRSESGELKTDSIDMEEVYANRSEMRMLRIGDSVAREGVRIAASVLKPNIVVTGGYLFSNPNVFDGFKNEWGGTWMAGVAVNVPIVHPAGIFTVKAAKAKRREAQLMRQEAEEMIALQVKKMGYELEVAEKHLTLSESDVAMAEENLKLADESFKAGMCSSSDLMAAQTAWMKAKSEVIDAEIEVAMGRVYLNKALGK